MTTKILAVTDALGNLVRFVLLPGKRYDTIGGAPLFENLSFDALLGDRSAHAVKGHLPTKRAKVL